MSSSITLVPGSLQTVDETFRKMSNLGGPHVTTGYFAFLIHRPVRSALLHKGGVLIVFELRREDRDGAIKARKDAMQASASIEALAGGAGRGEKLRELSEAGRRKLGKPARVALETAQAAAINA
jgi:hypothetical protein